MGINEFEELVTSSLNSNKFLSMENRNLFNSIIKDFANYFFEYGIDLNYDNLSSLLRELDTAADDNIDEICKYDSENNRILINRTSDASPEEIEKSYVYMVLSIISNPNQTEMIDDGETLIPKCGLEFEENGNKKGHCLDRKLKERIIEMIYGNDEMYTLPTIEDEFLIDVEKLVGSENLLVWFVNGRGDLLFENITSKLGMEQANELYDVTDKYENTDVNEIRELRLLEAKYEKIRANSLMKVDNNIIAL